MTDAPTDDLAPPPADVLVVGPELTIPRAEFVTRATRAGGPGGQHVNTSSTRIELLWNVLHSPSVTDEQRACLLDKLATRLDGGGWLRVVAADSRSQRQNRDRAESRLAETLRRAMVIPKRRRPTKPSRVAKQARLDEKRQQSGKKEQRRWKEEE